MGARFQRVRQATLALSACLLLAGVVATPAAAQDVDVCGVLTPEDLSAILPGTYVAPFGMEGACQWTGTTSSGGGVIVVAYLVPGSATDMPGAQVIDIDGRTAYSASDPSMTVPTHVVGVETDGDMFVLSVSVDDAAIDVPTVATALARAAIGRLPTSDGLPSSSLEPTGAAPSSEGPQATAMASTTPVAASSVCDLATPEEIAAAAGIDVELNVQDPEIACSWDVLSDDGYVLIYAALQEPEAFDAVLASLGAEEIDGPGEQDWWASSLASLFSRQGDLLLQVSYSSSVASDEDALKATTMKIMEVLLGT